MMPKDSSQQDAHRPTRRQFTLGMGHAWGLGWGAAGFVLSGCQSRREVSSRPDVFRVSGPSMTPAFWDVSQRIQCTRCGIETRVDAGLLRRALRLIERDGLASDVRCWHCGIEISSEHIRAELSRPTTPPDAIHVADCPLDDLVAGDVVLISKGDESQDHFHLKRILATPGQAVSNSSTGRLLVAGHPPLFDSVTLVPVDRDRYRETSRWSNGDAAPSQAITTPLLHSARWVRSEERQWVGSIPSQWLIYEHRNVYRADRPTPVFDDYSGNLGISRELFATDELSIQFRLFIQPSAAKREIILATAFRNRDGINLQQSHHEIPAGCDELLIEKIDRMRDRAVQTSERPVDGPALSRSRPVALRLSLTDQSGAASSDSVPCRITELCVDRPVLYRMVTNSMRSRVTPDNLTVTASDKGWFVVGDNVPLSIDSRTWGRVDSNEILGRVSGEPFDFI